MGADSQQRQRRHAKKVERLRRREADRRKASGTGAAPPGRTVETDFLGPSPGERPERKLSEILLELSQPFLPRGERSLADMQGTIGLAATVWNAVVLNPDGGEPWKLLSDTLREDFREEAPTVLRVASAMRDWKLDRYPSDLRGILNWTVTKRRGSFNVQVMSSWAGTEPCVAREGETRALQAESPPPSNAPWQRPLTRPP